MQNRNVEDLPASAFLPLPKANCIKKFNFNLMGDEMNPKKIKFAMLILIFTSLLLAVGCSKITQENYDKLKVGQDYDEVVKILGKADECSAAIGIKNCSWGDDKKFIKVNFAGNKVILFSAQGL